mgnify:CR=1 FL=1
MCAIHVSGCCRNDSVVSVSVPAFEQEISSDPVQLLDVRTPEEYVAGHIAGAININVQSDDFSETALNELSKDSTVYVYCRSGRRSLTAAEILAKLGYKVVNLKGGIIDWKENGFPVIDSKIVGVYEDGNDGSTLVISRNDGEYYKVELSLFRLTQLIGQGKLSGNTLTFSAIDVSGEPICGEILIEGNNAKLIITTSTWEYLPEGTTYKFERK